MVCHVRIALTSANGRGTHVCVDIQWVELHLVIGVDVLHLRADDDAVAAGGLLLVDVLILGGALGVVRVGAAGASAIKLDTVTRAGDSVALARAAAAGADAAGTAGVGGAGGEGWDIGVIIRLGVGLEVLLGKAAVELLEGGLVVLGVDDLAGLAGALGLGGDDALWGEGAALGDVGGGAAGLAVRAGGLGGLGWDVDDVELAASGGLGGVVLGGVVRDVVAVDDVVVPVSLTLLEGGTLELEGADPATGLLGVLGEWELSLVAVPGAEKVDGLAVGGSAESEVELDSGHCEVWFFFLKYLNYDCVVVLSISSWPS